MVDIYQNYPQPVLHTVWFNALSQPNWNAIQTKKFIVNYNRDLHNCSCFLCGILHTFVCRKLHGIYVSLTSEVTSATLLEQYSKVVV